MSPETPTSRQAKPSSTYSKTWQDATPHTHTHDHRDIGALRRRTASKPLKKPIALSAEETKHTMPGNMHASATPGKRNRRRAQSHHTIGRVPSQTCWGRSVFWGRGRRSLTSGATWRLGIISICNLLLDRLGLLECGHVS